MARFKKKKVEAPKEQVSLDQPLVNVIASSLQRISFVASSPDNIRSRITGWIPTGITLLNCAIADGNPKAGYPTPRAIQVFGPSGEGKTALALIAAKATQEIGGLVIWVEAKGESSFDWSWADKIGVAPGKGFIPTEAGSVEKLVKIIDDAIETEKAWFKKYQEHPYILIIVDTLEGLHAKEEEDGAISSKPRYWSYVFEKGLLGRIAETKISLLFISQIRSLEFGGTYTKQVIDSPGGKALKHAMGVKIELISFPMERTISGKKIPIGLNVHCKIVKNRVGTPFRIAAFPLYFDTGVDDLESCIDYLLETNYFPDEIKWSKDGMVILRGGKDRGGENKRKYSFLEQIRKQKDMETYYKDLAIKAYQEINFRKREE